MCRFDRLRTANRKRQKASAHIFDYIVPRVNPSLTSCEDLATALCNECIYSFLKQSYTGYRLVHNWFLESALSTS